MGLKTIDNESKQQLLSNGEEQSFIISQKPVLTSDEALAKAGSGNRYQVRACLLLAFQQIFQAFILQGQPFLFMEPDKFQCYKDVSNKSGSYPCDEQTACKQQNNRPDLLAGTANSLVVHFQLYCDREYLIGLTQSIYFGISNFAILLFSFLADKYGRRKVIVFCYIIGTFPILVGGFSPTMLFFMVAFIISGVGINPYSILIFVLMQEQSNQEFRQKTTVYLLMTWGIGQIVFIPIAYFFQQWDTLIIFFIGLPLVIQVFSFLFIYESVKWALISHNYVYARNILLKIAKCNNQPPQVLQDIQQGFYFQGEQKWMQREERERESESESEKESEKEKEKEQKQKKYGIGDLFRYKSTRFTTVGLSIIYFGIYMQYFGAIFALQSLGGNKYINAVILNVTELCSYILGVPVVKGMKRKVSFPGVFLLMSLSALVFLCKGDDSTTNIIMGVVCKVCVCVSFSVSYVYGPELYPTPIRSIGIGFCTFLGKFGAAVAPLIILLSDNHSINPMASFGIFTFIAFLFSLKLKETYGLNLQDQIPELVNRDSTADQMRSISQQNL